MRKQSSLSMGATGAGDKSPFSRHGTFIATSLMESLLSQDERAEKYNHSDDDDDAGDDGGPDQDIDAEAAQSPESSSTSPTHTFKSAVLKVRRGLAFAGVSKRRKSEMVPTVGRSLCAAELGTDFRIMDRRAAFGQSRGRWALHNIWSRKGWRGGSLDADAEDAWSAVSQLLLEDVYHTFLDAKFSIQILCFVVSYLVSFFVFAALYLAIDSPCNLKLDGSLIKAYLLSLETMVTIGYGVPDPYLNGCWQGPIVLTMQSLLQLFISALLIGVMFQGISRPQSRACTILFSQKAVIQCIDGAYYFMFRVADLRSQHALIEPHIRCYCVQQNERRGFEAIQIRLDQPDDELGGMLMLSMPSIVAHRIDAFSPLARDLDARKSTGKSVRFGRKPSKEGGSLSAACLEGAFRQATWPRPLQRMTACESGCRDSCVCPTCGETFPTLETLVRHCRYNAAGDAMNGYPAEACHHELNESELNQLCHKNPTKEEICANLRNNFKEIVVLVEGTEPTTSSTLQARQSYVVGPPENESCDTAWDMDFADCVLIPRDDVASGLGVDLGRFHMTRAGK